METNRKNDSELIVGRNCVTEALKNERPIDRVFVSKGAGGSLVAIIAQAKKAGAVIKEVDSRKLDSLCSGANHQGVVAFAAARQYASLDSIFELAQSRGESPFIIILDGIEDPHNLGAIIRTAECAGAHGVIIPKRRSAGLSHVVDKTSAGALEYLPVSRVVNLPTTIDELKQRGLWIYGADMHGQNYTSANLSGGAALVIGNEGKGISRLVREKCDCILSLPMSGKISSLNASVAAGILMYEFMRQRNG